MKEYQSSPEYRDYKQALMNRYDDQQELYCDFDQIVTHTTNQYEKEIEKKNRKKECFRLTLLVLSCVFLVSVLIMTVIKKDVSNRGIAFICLFIMSWIFISQLKSAIKEFLNKKYCNIAYGKVVKMYCPPRIGGRNSKSKKNRPENMVAIVYFPKDNKYVKDISLQKKIKDLNDTPTDVAVYKIGGIVIAQALEM